MTITSVSVDKEQFKGDEKIIAAEFGEKCTSIGESAFEDCTSLESINEDNVIESIGILAFTKTNLSTVSFKSLKELYPSAFSDCNNLKYVDISNYTSNIPEFAFRNCAMLEDIKIPNVSKIENGAFENCENLSQVVLSSCESIGSGAFKNCKKLSNIILSDNCTEIGSSAFYGCIGLENINLKNVKKIYAAAFYNCENLSQVTLSSCEFIDAGAFIGCNKLTDVYINNPEEMICKLSNSLNVFCNHIETSTECDKEIRFYVNASDYETYINDETWAHYKNKIVSKVNSKQIKYKTNNNSKLIINNETSYNIKSNEYYEKGEYGLIEFNYEIAGLSDMFKDQTTLTHIELPSTCKSIAHYSFSGCVNLTNIEMDGVIAIGLFAFENCKSLKTFKIPNNITNLNEGIFAGCENLERFEGTFTTYDGKAVVYHNKLISVVPKDNSITEGRIHNISEIDKNITQLGRYCFSGCKNMRRVDIPSNITSIGNNAFDGCSNLYEVHFVGNKPPETLGDNIFNNVNTDFKIFAPEASLTAFFNDKLIDKLHPKPESNCIIYYGNKLNGLRQTTKDYNFTNGKNITYHIIHDIKNNTVKEYFTNQKYINKVIIGDGLLNISPNAFMNCERLEYIYLSDKIQNIQNKCFYGCKSLKRIHIPSKAQFGNEIFCKCESLKEFGTYYKGYVSGDNICYTTPLNSFNYRNKKTLHFFAEGFLSSDNNYTYTIPQDIAIIADYAFRYSSIRNIDLKNVEIIGEYTFANCEKLTQIIKWDWVKTISNNAFMDCRNLCFSYTTAINYGLNVQNLTTIGDYAFQNCINMYITSEMTNVTSIGKYAFSGCSNFKYIDDISEQTQGTLKLGRFYEINDGVFKDCKSLEKIDINTVKKINANAFYGCLNLSTVTTKGIITNIGDSAFEDCSNLTAFIPQTSTTPMTLQIIGNKAFKNCKKFNCEIPNNIQSLGSGCFEGSGITHFTLSESSNITSIPDNICKDCSNLEYIDIVNSNITYIGSYAFANTSLKIGNGKENFIPNNVVRINDNAFQKCSGIKIVYLPQNLTHLGDCCFDTGTSDTNIYLPKFANNNVPEFTINNILNTNSNPFGKTTDSNIPYIYILYGFELFYNSNDYWSKYKSMFRKY